MAVFYQQGEYRAQIVDQGFSESKNGTPLFYLVIVPLEDQNGNPVQDRYDRHIRWHITERTIDFVIEKLERLGFNANTFSAIDPRNEDHISFVDQVVDVYCKHDVYEGETNEKWDLSNPNAGIQALDSVKARELDALFGAKLKERARSKPKPRKEAPPTEKKAPTEAVPNTKDIPF